MAVNDAHLSHLYYSLAARRQRFWSFIKRLRGIIGEINFWQDNGNFIFTAELKPINQLARSQIAAVGFKRLAWTRCFLFYLKEKWWRIIIRKSRGWRSVQFCAILEIENIKSSVNLGRTPLKCKTEGYKLLRLQRNFSLKLKNVLSDFLIPKEYKLCRPPSPCHRHCVIYGAWEKSC